MDFEIVHELPGRLRARSPHPISKKAAQFLCDSIAAIEGVTGVRISHHIASALVLYNDPNAREIIIGKLCEPVSQEKLAKIKRPKQEPLPVGGILRYLFSLPVLPGPAKAAMAVKGGIPFIHKGFRSILKGKLNVDVLDATAIAISLIRLDFATAGLLIALLGFGEALAEWTRKKSLTSLEQYLAYDIDLVWIDRGGKEYHVPLNDMREGDLVIARAGYSIPVDGIVASGEGIVNQSSMTGEPLGVFRTAGASVYAGTVVEEGELRIRPTEVGENTRLRQVVSFVKNSESQKSLAQSKSEHLADAFVPFTFLLAGGVWAVTQNLMRATSVLLVDYSCALRLATPLSVLSAMREGAVRGALVKGGRFLEKLAEADTVVFDKTGTLTAAQPEVARVVAAPGHKRNEVLRLSACLEEHFPHPVARAVVRQAAKEELHHEEEHTEVEYVVAHGVVSKWHGHKVCIGSEHFIRADEHIDISEMEDTIQQLTEQGLSLLYLAINGKLAGIIGIKDTLRPEAASVVNDLRNLGINRIVMLTGDAERSAAVIARKLGITEWRAQVLPGDKAAIINELKAHSKAVMMVGDGINDAPALSAADVGVSMRDGSDLAREVADVVLTQGQLTELLTARELGRRFMRRVHANFVTIMGLNSIFLAGSLFGLLTPGLAAALHNATTIGVALNAVRPMLPLGTETAPDTADIFDNLEENYD